MRAGVDMKIVSLLFHDVYASDPLESGFRSPAANRYKLSIPEFEMQLDGLVEAGVDTPLLAAAWAASDDNGSRIPDTESRTPALISFDDGGESYYSAAADRLE